MSGFGLCKAAKGFTSHSPEQVFDDNQIVDAALEYLVEHGFPYRTLSKHDCMQKINKLANTDNEELLYSVMGYDVADSYHPHRFEGRYHVSKYSPVAQRKIWSMTRCQDGVILHSHHHPTSVWKCTATRRRRVVIGGKERLSGGMVFCCR